MSNDDPKDGLPLTLKGLKTGNAHRGIRNPSGVADVSRPAQSLHGSKSAHPFHGSKANALSQSGSGTGAHSAPAPSELNDDPPVSGYQGASGMPLTARRQSSQIGIGKVEYSKISGLNDASHHLTAGNPTRLSVELFRGSTQHVQGISRGVIVFLVIVALGALAAVPKIRHRTIATISKVRSEMVKLARHRKGPQQRRSSAELELSADGSSVSPSSARAAAVQDDAPKTFNAGACTSLIREAQIHPNSGLRTRVQTADCLLIKDDPANAEKVLTDIAGKVRVRGGMRSEDPDMGGFGEAILTLQSAYLKQGNESAANQVVSSGCIDWRQSTSCVAKLMVAAARRPIVPLSGDANKMFSSKGLLPAKSEARLWLAGAQLASATGAGDKTVEQRFKYALDTAPKDAAAVRKDIWEARVMDQWQRGDTAAIKLTLKAAQKDLAAVSPTDLVKLKLMGELADVGSAGYKLHALLTREDILYRARGDLDLLDIVGPVALRTGLLRDYLQLLHRTRDYYATRYHTGNGANKRLAVWEIRGALAGGDADAAIGLLTNYSRSFGDDALSRHLRGIAYLGLTSSASYQKLAAQEFQAAIRIKRDWESMYGLGIALIRARRSAQIPSLLADLTKLTRTVSQRYWLDMLRVELVLIENNYTEAQRILSQYSNAQPPWLTARRLQLQVYQKTGKTLQAEQLQNDIKIQTGRSPFTTSSEGFASPLGCMALTQRPVE